MMITCEISRYGPGVMITDSIWTAHSDIGKEFEDGILTQEKFDDTEARYLQAVDVLLAGMNQKNLRIYGAIALPWRTAKKVRPFRQGQRVGTDRVRRAFRSALRDELSFTLIESGKSYLWLSPDLALHFGTLNDIPDPRARIEELGLYVDPQHWLLEDLLDEWQPGSV